MAWALQFDGQNDYADISTPIDLTGDFTIEFELDLSASRNDGFIESSTGTNNFFGKLNNNSIYCRLGGQTITYSQTPPPGVNKYKWIKSGNNITCYFNGVVKNSSTTFTGGSTLNRFGRFQGGSNMLGQLLSCTGVDSNGASFNYDPTSSSHAAGTPILTDTAGGNNATGVNMPTDGSAWVNLGGSGTSITATLGTIEYNSNDTVIGLAGNIDITATLGSINYSSNDTSIQVSGDVSVIATLGNISYASNDAAISLFGNIDVTATLGTIDYNSNDANISLLGGINVNATLGAIDYTSNNTAITLQGQTALTTTLGAISYDSNSVIVQVGTGQVIGNVTAGFADNLYSAGFKPSEITVNFKT